MEDFWTKTAVLKPPQKNEVSDVIDVIEISSEKKLWNEILYLYLQAFNPKICSSQMN